MKMRSGLLRIEGRKNSGESKSFKITGTIQLSNMGVRETNTFYQRDTVFSYHTAV